MSVARPTVMVVDDTPSNRDLLRGILEDTYTVAEFASGEEALDYLERRVEVGALSYDDMPHAILLDVMMPGKDGFETLAAIKAMPVAGAVPVLFITADDDVASETRGLKMGAADYIYKPFNNEMVRARVDSHVNLFGYTHAVTRFVEDKTRRLVKTHEKTLETLLTIIEYRSLETGGHIARVRELTRILVDCLKETPKFRAEIIAANPELIVKASVMHDVGKIGIPDNILLKPARLTPEEFATIKKHSVIGADIVESMDMADAPGDDALYLRHCKDICRHHHERWDGTGYPDKLAGEDIPLSARIVSIIDVYDALVSTRCYRPGFSLDETYAVIRAGSGTQFQPDLVKALFEVHGKFEKVSGVEKR